VGDVLPLRAVSLARAVRAGQGTRTLAADLAPHLEARSLTSVSERRQRTSASRTFSAPANASTIAGSLFSRSRSRTADRVPCDRLAPV
jgi:hypothetical protein